MRALAPARMLRDISAAFAHPTHPGAPHDDPEDFDILPYVDIWKPYLEMLIAPSQHCDKEKPASCRSVHRALDTLLRFQLDDDIATLPDLDTFGPAPTHLIPSHAATSHVDQMTDAALLSHMSTLTPPVPRTATGSSGHEAEARPRVQAARRSKRLAGRQA